MPEFVSLGKHYSGMPGSTVGPVPIARMYGITMQGNSLVCHIHGFVPYFFVPAPMNMKKDDCHAFKDALNKAVLQDMRSNKDNVVQVSFSVVVSEKVNLKLKVIKVFFGNNHKFRAIGSIRPYRLFIFIQWPGFVSNTYSSLVRSRAELQLCY